MRRISSNFRDALNLRVDCADIFTGEGADDLFSREPIMSKTDRIFSFFSAPRVYTERSAIPARQSDGHEFVAVALFAGIGLFVSLLAVITGIQGAWF
jgi:hypothetical protein